MVGGMWGCAGVVGGELVGGGVEEKIDADAAAGFALLYELCEKQRKADGVYVLKSGSATVKGVVQEIAAANGVMADALKSATERGEAVGDLKATGLPGVEVSAREAIEGQRTKAILFGEDWEKVMVLSQLEATSYGAALAGSLEGEAGSEVLDAALRAYGEAMSGANVMLAGMVVVGEEKE